MTASPLRLYHYWRSSCSWRVRWAFSLKGISCDFVAVNLLDDETSRPEHRNRNPMGFVPVLEWAGERKFLTESMAIIEWAEETCPNPALLPGDAYRRALSRQLAETINSGTAPLQNLSVLEQHSEDPAARKKWAQHWIRNGLAAYEALAKPRAGRFSMGDELTLADLFLIPQCYNARRQEVSLEEFPTILRIEREALLTPSCKASHPDRFQPAS